MEAKFALVYLLVAASTCFTDIRTEHVVKAAEEPLQRIKRLDHSDEDALSRVKRLDDPYPLTSMDRIRRDVEESEEDPPNVDNDQSRDDDVTAEGEDEKERKSVFLGPNAAEDDDENGALKLSLIEFNPELNDPEQDETITKRFDKQLMKIKRKWKSVMRKRGHSKHRIKQKMKKRLKHKEAKDIATLKRKRKQRLSRK